MESRRRYITAGAEKGNERSASEDGSTLSVSVEGTDGGDVPVFQRKRSGVRPWRTTQDVPRACLDVVIAGVGYLLYLPPGLHLSPRPG